MFGRRDGEESFLELQQPLCRHLHAVSPTRNISRSNEVRTSLGMPPDAREAVGASCCSKADFPALDAYWQCSCVRGRTDSMAAGLRGRQGPVGSPDCAASHRCPQASCDDAGNPQGLTDPLTLAHTNRFERPDRDCALLLRAIVAFTQSAAVLRVLTTAAGCQALSERTTICS